MSTEDKIYTAIGFLALGILFALTIVNAQVKPPESSTKAYQDLSTSEKFTYLYPTQESYQFALMQEIKQLYTYIDLKCGK